MDVLGDEIGQIVRRVRRAMNLTQVDMGKQLGIAATTVSMYELGEREPSINLFVWFLEQDKSVVLSHKTCPTCLGAGRVLKLKITK